MIESVGKESAALFVNLGTSMATPPEVLSGGTETSLKALVKVVVITLARSL